MQWDAEEWYGHELEGSEVPQHGVVELPGDDGLGVRGQRVSRASVSGMYIYMGWGIYLPAPFSLLHVGFSN